MSPYETIDLYFSISNRIDLQWGLFITVHLALFGGIIYVDRPLRITEKTGAIILYAGFATINYLVMNNQLTLMSNLYMDIINLSVDDCCSHLHVIQRLAEEEKGGKSEITQNVVFVSHTLMFLLAIGSIVFDRALSVKDSEEAE